jgi:cell wall-associated NlpC family hydrolase
MRRDAAARRSSRRARERSRRSRPVLALLGILLALPLVVAAGSSPVAVARAQAAPSSGQGQQAGLLAEARAALGRWDAQQATIEDSAEHVNGLVVQVTGLQAKIAGLQVQQRAVARELTGSDAGPGQDPIARLRSVAGRFFNSFATALSGTLGGEEDQRDYAPVLYDLPEAVDQHQRQGEQLQQQRQTLRTLHGRLRADKRQTPPEVRELAARLAKQDEQARQQAYSAWAGGVQDQFGALTSGPLQPAEVARVALTFALAQVGRPYLWGATGPGSYDCSGLTSTAYRQVGLTIPRVSIDQSRFGQPVEGLNNLVAGDLVFFGNPVHHVGMYYQDGMMVHAPHTGDVVRVASIWRSGYAGARRPVAAVGGPAAGLPAAPALPPPPEMSRPETTTPGPPVTPSTGTTSETTGPSTSTSEPPSTGTEPPATDTSVTEPPPTGAPPTTGSLPNDQPATSAGAFGASGVAARGPPL